MKNKRIFFGFPIDKILTGKLIDFKDNFVKKRIYSSEYKWVKANNYHLTLLFVGSVSEDEIPEICSKAEKIVAEVSDFILEPEYFTAFPHRKPKMIWLKYQPSETFGKLVLEFRKSILKSDKSGQALPHITLARIKRGYIEDQLRESGGIANLHCDTLHLYESELTPNGPIYSILKTFKLINNPV